MVGVKHRRPRCEYQEANVVVQMSVLLRGIHFMNIKVDGAGPDSQTIDTGFFCCLRQRDCQQVGVAIGVATRLHPNLELGVMQSSTRSNSAATTNALAVKWPGRSRRSSGAGRCTNNDCMAFRVSRISGPFSGAIASETSSRRDETCNRLSLAVIHSATIGFRPYRQSRS